MTKKTKWGLVAVLGTLALFVAFGLMKGPSASDEGQIETAVESPAAARQVPGQVTMIDLGMLECIPCKLMAPIIEELQEEYEGKANIVFINVNEDPGMAEKYGIQAVPTQIFFDENGIEVFRHLGFMDRDQIVKILTGLGVS